MLKKKRKNKGGNIGSCPQVPVDVVGYLLQIIGKVKDLKYFPVVFGRVAIVRQPAGPTVRQRWVIFHFHRSSKNQEQQQSKIVEYIRRIRDDHTIFRGEGYFWIKLNLFVFFIVKLFFSTEPTQQAIQSGLKRLSWLNDPTGTMDKDYAFRVQAIYSYIFSFNSLRAMY